MIKHRKRIICAGTYRSGSTWLFNVIRFIFLSNHIDIQSNFANSGSWDDKSSVHLIKTHIYQPQLMRGNVTTFTTIRDLRDIVASGMRVKMEGILDKGDNLSFEKIVSFIDVTVEQYRDWKEHSDLEVRFEEMMKNKKGTIQKIANVLNQRVDVDRVHEAVDRLSAPLRFDPVSLLWPNHISNPAMDRSIIFETLNEEQVAIIEEKYQDFIKTAAEKAKTDRLLS